MAVRSGSASAIAALPLNSDYFTDNQNHFTYRSTPSPFIIDQRIKLVWNFKSKSHAQFARKIHPIRASQAELVNRICVVVDAPNIFITEQIMERSDYVVANCL